jgi:hypothetical protein
MDNHAEADAHEKPAEAGVGSGEAQSQQPVAGHEASLRAAYEALRLWFREQSQSLADASRPSSSRAASIERSLPTIRLLLPEQELSDLEIRVVLFQISAGTLSWSGWDTIQGMSVRQFLGSAYSLSGIRPELTPAERRAFRDSNSKLREVFSNI